MQVALQTLHDILRAARPRGLNGAEEAEAYVDPNCGELWAVVRLVLKDSNKNIVVQGLALLALAVAAVGAHINQNQHTQIKSLLPLVVAALADNKKGVRDAALACLDACRGRVQRELMLKNLRAAVGMEAPVGREEALRWCFVLKLSKNSTVDLLYRAKASSNGPPAIAGKIKKNTCFTKVRGQAAIWHSNMPR